MVVQISGGLRLQRAAQVRTMLISMMEHSYWQNTFKNSVCFDKINSSLNMNTDICNIFSIYVCTR